MRINAMGEFYEILRAMFSLLIFLYVNYNFSLF